MNKVFTILCFLLLFAINTSFAQCIAPNEADFISCANGSSNIDVNATYTVDNTPDANPIDISGQTITIDDNQALIINTKEVIVDGSTVFVFGNGNSTLLAYGFIIEDNKSGDIREDELNAALAALGTSTATLEDILQALPVQFSHFSGKWQNNQIKLEWGTNSELNNDFFEVEFSTDTKHFQPIKKIAGAGTTDEPQEYAFTHYEYIKGANYYRIKQVDYDGAFDYSKLIVVRTPIEDNIYLYPSFVYSDLNFVLKDISDVDTDIEIVDMSGKIVYRQTIASGTLEGAIDVSDLTQGHYLLRLAGVEMPLSKRFFKLP